MEKNIAILVPTLYGGGAERIAGLLAKHLSEKNKVYIFVLDDTNIMYDYAGELVNIAVNGAYFYEYYVRKYKSELKIECAISFMELMNYLNIKTKQSEKVIISERCAHPPMSIPLYRERSIIFDHYNCADAVIACAQGVEYDLTSHFGINREITQTIYNFIDKEKIIKKSKEPLDSEIANFIKDSKVILNVGRLTDQKNQERLIYQFSYLIKEIANVKLLIIGKGDLNANLEELICKLNLRSQVKIINYNSNPFPYYRIADVFALTSKFEGLPNVLLEAMLLNVPIAAVDCLSGPRELLADDLNYNQELGQYIICSRGILVTNLKSEDDGKTRFFMKAMKILLEDDNLINDIKFNEAKYMDKYKNENIMRQWEEVIYSDYNHNKKTFERNDFTLSRKIIVYGAGYIGKQVMVQLLGKKDDLELLCFAVTSEMNNPKELFGIPVIEIDKLTQFSEDALVVVGVTEQYQDEIISKISSLNFKNIVFPVLEEKNYEFYGNLTEDMYEKELASWYQIRTEKELYWNNLRTYNEKIQWLKLHDNNEMKSNLADKLKVREYVKDKIGEKYLVPLLGHWDKFEDIDFSKLPSEFILKCNHGSGWNQIVRNKETIEYEKMKKQFDDWMMLNYAFVSGLEMHYKNIKPQIIAEELIKSPEDCELRDYKVFIFDGKAKIIQVDIDRSTNHRRNLYSPNWDILPVGIGFPMAPDIHIDKPECLDELISVTEKLGEGFRHVRVDFYIANNKLLFGEMTFAHGSGTEMFTSYEFAEKMGSWIKIDDWR